MSDQTRELARVAIEEGDHDSFLVLCDLLEDDDVTNRLERLKSEFSITAISELLALAGNTDLRIVTHTFLRLYDWKGFQVSVTANAISPPFMMTDLNVRVASDRENEGRMIVNSDGTPFGVTGYAATISFNLGDELTPDNVDVDEDFDGDGTMPDAANIVTFAKRIQSQVREAIVVIQTRLQKLERAIGAEPGSLCAPCRQILLGLTGA